MKISYNVLIIFSINLWVCTYTKPFDTTDIEFNTDTTPFNFDNLINRKPFEFNRKPFEFPLDFGDQQPTNASLEDVSKMFTSTNFYIHVILILSIVQLGFSAFIVMLLFSQIKQMIKLTPPKKPRERYSLIKT